MALFDTVEIEYTFMNNGTSAGVAVLMKDGSVSCVWTDGTRERFDSVAAVPNDNYAPVHSFQKDLQKGSLQQVVVYSVFVNVNDHVVVRQLQMINEAEAEAEAKRVNSIEEQLTFLSIHFDTEGSGTIGFRVIDNQCEETMRPILYLTLDSEAHTVLTPVDDHLINKYKHIGSLDISPKEAYCSSGNVQRELKRIIKSANRFTKDDYVLLRAEIVIQHNALTKRFNSNPLYTGPWFADNNPDLIK
jgi:hypothetical protein